MKTLVLGYGNALRGDDGAGPAVAERLAGCVAAEVQVRVTHQLQIEWAWEWAQHERVILVDAAVGGEAVAFESLPALAGGEAAASHGCNPTTLLRVTELLYGRVPEVHLCRVRAESFEFGEGLTPVVRTRVKEAVRRLKGFLSRDRRGAGGGR